MRKYERLKIKDFTILELIEIRKLCNFTELEHKYFNLRSKDYSNVQISLVLHISESTVSKIAKRVKSKIERIL